MPGNQSGIYLTNYSCREGVRGTGSSHKDTLTEGEKFYHEPAQFEGVTDLCETPLGNLNEFIIGGYYIVSVRDL